MLHEAIFEIMCDPPEDEPGHIEPNVTDRGTLTKETVRRLCIVAYRRKALPTVLLTTRRPAK